MKKQVGKAAERMQQLLHKQYNPNEIRIRVDYLENTDSKNGINLLTAKEYLKQFARVSESTTRLPFKIDCIHSIPTRITLTSLPEKSC